MDALSTKVTDEISLGEELHADEQSPSFLYTEVSGLRTKWEKLQDVAALKEKELMVIESRFKLSLPSIPFFSSSYFVMAP